MLRPPKEIAPSLGNSRSNARAKVDLPDPDSPTMPMVWPWRSVIDTRSTARSMIGWPSGNPPPILKLTRTSVPSRIFGADGSTGALRPVGSAANRAFVYSCFGLAKIAAVSPSSTTSPKRIT